MINTYYMIMINTYYIKLILNYLFSHDCLNKLKRIFKDKGT